MHRSIMRQTLGRTVFTAARYFRWVKDWSQLTRSHVVEDLPYVVATHRTPLRRPFAGIDERLTRNKIENITIALRRVNGIMVQPGKMFSYWFTIGNPTRRKGYLPGFMLHQGRLVEGTGGGLCQLSNLLYWLTLHTPLTVIERWRHGYDVFPDASRMQPFGSGATCYYPFLDLVIKNSTTAVFALHVFIDGDDLVGEWRSNMPLQRKYVIVEREHAFEALPWGGWLRKNTLVQQEIDTLTGEVMHERVVAKNEAITMYEPLLR